MVIGCITESQKLINDAVNAQQEGGNVNMCKALEKLEEKGRQEGGEWHRGNAILLRFSQ